MDLQKMILELEAEKQRLDHAIEALERLSARNGVRRGRPPAWLKKQMDDSQTPVERLPESEERIS